MFQLIGSLITKLQEEALGNKAGGVDSGAPSFTDFFDQVAKLRDATAAGADLIHGAVWKHSPHWFKCRLFDLLERRFFDVEWNEEDMKDWQEFELCGIPKIRNHKSFNDYRWLGILTHICKCFAATHYRAVKRTMKNPSRSCSYGYKIGTSVDDCFAVLYMKSCLMQRSGKIPP